MPTHTLSYANRQNEEPPPLLKCEYMIQEHGNYRCSTQKEYFDDVYKENVQGGAAFGVLIIFLVVAIIVVFN